MPGVRSNDSHDLSINFWQLRRMDVAVHAFGKGLRVAAVPSACYGGWAKVERHCFVLAVY
jgi:hypothetical protein